MSANSKSAQPLHGPRLHSSNEPDTQDLSKLQIPLAVQQLENSLSLIAQRAKALHERLSPVLTLSDSSKVKASGEAETPGVSLANQIHRLRLCANDIVALLENALNNLQL